MRGLIIHAAAVASRVQLELHPAAAGPGVGEGGEGHFVKRQRRASLWAARWPTMDEAAEGEVRVAIAGPALSCRPDLS
eukprot:2874966-Rhodomonas_salina.2